MAQWRSQKKKRKEAKEKKKKRKLGWLKGQATPTTVNLHFFDDEL
jgi:hypothetical protein